MNRADLKNVGKYDAYNIPNNYSLSRLVRLLFCQARSISSELSDMEIYAGLS